MKRSFWLFAIGAGLALRWAWLSDMEYKSDEMWMHLRALHQGVDEPWRWLGQSSTVYVRHPGLGMWLFVFLGKLLGATPLRLVAGVVALNSLALIAFYRMHRLFSGAEELAWKWSVALYAVNPFAVLYQRKIWIQSVLPLFTALLVLAFLKRKTRGGAFFWGLLSVFIGQIHMSGIFFAAAFFIQALWNDRRVHHFGLWLAGVALGLPTLAPWVWALLHRPHDHPMVFGASEALQFKYWVFWITDPFGLHLGNALGVKLGNGLYAQLGEFFKYPGGTYGVALLHLGLAALFVATLYRRACLREKSGALSGVLRATGLFYGALMTMVGIAIHRFYLIIAGPLESTWVARAWVTHPRAQRWLLALFAFELSLTLAFLTYVHEHGGALQGDYGPSYRVQEKREPVIPW